MLFFIHLLTFYSSYLSSLYHTFLLQKEKVSLFWYLLSITFVRFTFLCFCNIYWFFYFYFNLFFLFFFKKSFSFHFHIELSPLFSFQSQWRAMPKNVQTTVQFHSFHMLARLYSKSFKLSFSSKWTENFQMFNLGFEEAEEPEIKLSTLDFQKNTYFCSIDYSKAFV